MFERNAFGGVGVGGLMGVGGLTRVGAVVHDRYRHGDMSIHSPCGALETTCILWID